MKAALAGFAHNRAKFSVHLRNNLCTNDPLYFYFLLQQTRMEERLDDAIYVLRNHAESNQLLAHPMAMGPPPHSNGLVAPPNMGPSPSGDYPGGPHLTPMHPAPPMDHAPSHLVSTSFNLL